MIWSRPSSAMAASRLHAQEPEPRRPARAVGAMADAPEATMPRPRCRSHNRHARSHAATPALQDSRQARAPGACASYRRRRARAPPWPPVSPAPVSRRDDSAATKFRHGRPART
jgi:hypothetical protein